MPTMIAAGGPTDRGMELQMTTRRIFLGSTVSLGALATFAPLPSLADLVASPGARTALVIGNQRYVGNVGWRQHEQTYDSLSLVNTTPWNQSLGILDGAGRGVTNFTIPSGTTGLAGLNVAHATLLYDLGLGVVTGATNHVTLAITP